MSKFIKGFTEGQVVKTIVTKTVGGYFGCPQQYYVLLICCKGYIEYSRLVERPSSGRIYLPAAYNLNEKQALELEIWCEEQVVARYSK